ncbi:hypothetical protein C1J01_43515 [Nonomuraea aridisoli]|uniref:Uncharacterized protein n=1 Tax=Nonomuraea aridisoli TaxID=2070368 RepID=A0A2W2EKX4_9ACTN|nr:hypothetical protein C1J01_43515 [Nonomuraea aridisoli]
MVRFSTCPLDRAPHPEPAAACTARGVRLRRTTPTSKRRYATGDSLEIVGSRLGFSACTVRTHLLGAGVNPRDTPGYR